MKIKTKFSIIVIAIMVVVVTVVAVMLLHQASSISLDLSRQNIRYLAEQQAEFWQGRENGYIRALRTLANVMGDYESLPAEVRRDRFDYLLQSTLDLEPNMVAIYNVWKPNAIDGMDELNIGRTGSSPTGQYAMIYSRETGEIAAQASNDIDNVMAHITGPNALKDRADYPAPRTVNGKDTFIVRLVVPIVNQRINEVVGGVGCFMSIDAAQLLLGEDIASHKEISAMALYAGNGFIVGSSMPEQIGKMLLDEQGQYGDKISEVNKAVLDGKEFSLRSWSSALKTDLEMVLVPFKIGDSDATWTIMIGASENYIMTGVNTMTKFTVILSAIAIAAAAVIVYFVLNKITDPIVKVADTLKDIAEGEGDLTRSIAVNSKDEIGDLAMYFNKTLEKIKALVINIKKEAADLSHTGNDLATNMIETASAVNQITANIQNIKGRVMNQSASVAETNATMEQVVTNIDKLNGFVENQSNTVSQSSSSIEEMAASINSVTNTLVNNADNVKVLREASEAGRTSLQEVAANIHEINRQSEGLLKINALMKNIASQTNLLSMNAAIEAAHAGEAGKGFGVVAGEIRKLAESSGEQSKMIGDVLGDIQKSFNTVTKATEIVLNKFQAIDESVRIVAEEEDNIRNAMEEQRTGSKHLLQGTSVLNEMTRLAKRGSNEMLEESKGVINESKNLKIVTQEITSSVDEMASGAEQINTAVSHINEISIKNHRDIENLMREVSRFKVA